MHRPDKITRRFHVFRRRSWSFNLTYPSFSILPVPWTEEGKEEGVCIDAMEPPPFPNCISSVTIPVWLLLSAAAFTIRRFILKCLFHDCWHASVRGRQTEICLRNLSGNTYCPHPSLVRYCRKFLFSFFACIRTLDLRSKRLISTTLPSFLRPHANSERYILTSYVLIL